MKILTYFGDISFVAKTEKVLKLHWKKLFSKQGD